VGGVIGIHTVAAMMRDSLAVAQYSVFEAYSMLTMVSC